MAKWIKGMNRMAWLPNTRRWRKIARRDIAQIREEFPEWARQHQAVLDAVDKRKRRSR